MTIAQEIETLGRSYGADRIVVDLPGGERVRFTPHAIFAAAGTYDISVQWKATSDSVTASERKLWVWTQAFG